MISEATAQIIPKIMDMNKDVSQNDREKCLKSILQSNMTSGSQFLKKNSKTGSMQTQTKLMAAE